MRLVFQILLILSGALALVSCSGGDMSDSVIAQNPLFVMKGDSLIKGDTVLYCLDGKTLKCNLVGENGSARSWELPEIGNSVRTYESNQKVADYLYQMSEQVIAGKCTYASSNDVYDAITLCDAYLNPSRAMSTLRARVHDGAVGRCGRCIPGTLCVDCALWIATAWEVYKVTGDAAWLRYAYDITKTTLARDLETIFDSRSKLAYGALCSMDERNLMFPKWMDEGDIFASHTLCGNITAVHALDAATQMAEELGIDDDGLADAGTGCRDAVNQSMWNEAAGRYCALLYHGAYPMQSPTVDNRAQALSIIWEISTDADRDVMLMEKTPVTHYGVFPYSPSNRSDKMPGCEYRSWGIVQGVWNLAAAHVDNENMLRRGMAALLATQLLQCSGLVTGGSPEAGAACAVANVAMIYKVIAGLNFTPDGIEFNPVVPVCFGGDKVIRNLKYRKGVLDITVKGTGNSVDFILLDGKRVDGNFVPAEKLEGRHSIILTMNGNHKSDAHVTIAASGMRIPDAPTIERTSDSVRIVDFDESLAYWLVVNGERSNNIAQASFVLPAVDNFTEFSVVAASKYGYGYTSRAMVLPGAVSYHVPVVAPAAGSDTVSATFNTSAAGTYWLSVLYSGKFLGSDMRTVSANTHVQGVVAMPGLEADSLESRTTMFQVELLRGRNTILFSRPMGAASALIKRVDLYKK